MSKPWSIVFYKNILFVIHDDVFIVVCHNNLHRTFLLLWDWLGLDAWVDLAVNKVLYEFTDRVCRELVALIKGKFAVIRDFLDRKCRPCIRLEVEIASMSPKSLRVNRGESDGTFMLLSERFESFGEFFPLIFSFCENVC